MALVFLLFSQGRDKVPAYWLGAFFNPRRFLSIIKQVQKKMRLRFKRDTLCFLSIKALKSGSKPFQLVLLVFACLHEFFFFIGFRNTD